MLFLLHIPYEMARDELLTVVIRVNETSSGLRGPAVDEGLVVSLTAIVFARASTGNATAVPFTA